MKLKPAENPIEILEHACIYLFRDFFESCCGTVDNPIVPAKNMFEPTSTQQAYAQASDILHNALYALYHDLPYSSK